jgi:hypothetical protein
VTDLADRLQELAEGAAGKLRHPGADLARQEPGRRWRLVAGVALAAVLAVGLVQQGRLADWPTPAPPTSPGRPDVTDEVPSVDPSSLRLPGVPDVGHGRLPGGGSWRLQVGRYEFPNPDGTRDLVGNLVVAVQGRPKASAMRTFQEPVQLAMEPSMTGNQNLKLPVRPVFGPVSPRATRVVVVPRRDATELPPIRAELLDSEPSLSVRFWVALVPAGGTPAQTVHQVRSYDAAGRELCRLSPDTLSPRCTEVFG